MWYTIALVIGLFISIMIGLVVYMGHSIINPKTKSRAFAFEHDFSKGKLDLEGWTKLPKEAIEIPSDFGYPLSGYWIPQLSKTEAKGTVVLCHGHAWNLVGSIKYVSLFYKRGFNVLLYDHRNHGESGGTFTSFGAYESLDLKRCIDYAIQRSGQSYVGTHGESMGGAIVLQHAALDERVRFVIADCPFSDLSTMLQRRLTSQFPVIGKLCLPLVRIGLLWYAHFDINQIKPIEAVQKMEHVPLLLIHGIEDTYVPAQMSEALFREKKGHKKIWLVAGATHATSLPRNPEAYDALVESFLKEVQEE